MKPNENKNREQSIVLQKWKEANFIGTYVGFTGVGKTKIGTIAAAEFIRRNPNETSLVVVPTENLRDNEWEKSFNDWGYSRERPKVEIMCVQSAYKLTERHFNTIVIDEFHTALTEQYSKILTNNTFDRLLCLTATLNDDKVGFAARFAPVIWNTPRERAISLKLVSESMIFNLGVELQPRERELYDAINEQYLKNEERLGGSRVAFDASSRFLRLSKIDWNGMNMRVFIPENRVIYATEINDVNIPSSQCRLLTLPEVALLKDKIAWSKSYWQYMRERRTLLISAKNKIEVVKQLCDRYPDRKGIIFSESTTFADQIAEVLGDKCGTYHSKLTPTKKAAALAGFSGDDLQWMSSVKALNAGMDVPDCSLGIGTSGDSKKLTLVQRNGRISRYIDGKVAYFFNLFCIDTQEERWARNSTKLMEPKWIYSIDEAPIN